jgi:hypothetical protein
VGSPEAVEDIHRPGQRNTAHNALLASADIYIINRDNVTWLVDYYQKLHEWPFDMVVLDESSSFKNHRRSGSDPWNGPRPDLRIVELTGTPAPNGLIDLWSQIFLLDGGSGWKRRSVRIGSITSGRTSVIAMWYTAMP